MIRRLSGHGYRPGGRSPSWSNLSVRAAISPETRATVQVLFSRLSARNIAGETGGCMTPMVAVRVDECAPWERLTAAGHGKITAEIRPAPEFLFAEAYHQQYLHKNPNAFCTAHGTGVSCPVGLLGGNG
jgi:hypothetical protein